MFVTQEQYEINFEGIIIKLTITSLVITFSENQIVRNNEIFPWELIDFCTKCKQQLVKG